MIRVLVLIAITGFFVSLVTLASAIAIGGPEAIAAGAWAWSPDGGWRVGRNIHVWSDGPDRGPQATRQLTWSGGDSLSIDVPAEVTYTQAAGPPKITVSGPQRLVQDVEIDNGRIQFDHARRHFHGGSLKIVMTAPAVTDFQMSGSGALTIADYRQAKLKLDLSGGSEVTVSGDAGVLDLDISGAADADMTNLKLKGAEVDISGSGAATLAPTDWAKLGISGSGDVTLLTRPAKLETDISGSGSIHQGEQTPPATAEPSAGPKPART